MDISYKGPYTIIEQDDVIVTVDIVGQKFFINEVQIFVPALNSHQILTSPKAFEVGTELVEKYLAAEASCTIDPSEYNFKIFA